MKHIICLTVACILALCASAQSPVKMSLGDCLNVAHQNNLGMKNSALQIQKAEHLQKTAFTLNPTGISLSQDLTTGESPDNAVGLTQEFSLPSVYTARIKSLKAQTQAARRQQDVDRMELDQQITSAYYNILYARAKYEVLLQQDSAYTRFHENTAIKEAQGETGRLAHLNADKKTQDSRIGLRNAQNDILKAQYQLAVLMNCDTLVDPTETRFEQIPATSDSNDLRTAYSSLGDAKIKAAEMALKETHREALPTLSLEARYYAMIGGFDPHHVNRTRYSNLKGFVLLGLGVNVPLTFGAHSAKVKAAKRDVEILNNERLQQQNEIDALSKNKLLECNTAQQNIDNFRKGRLKSADELLHVAEVSYEQGEIDYLELMENISQVSDTRLQYIDAVNQYNQAMIVLNYLK